MAETVTDFSAETRKAIQRLQWFTVGWMTIEVVVAFIGAISAQSVALAAFGGDSAIELLSATTVLSRFRLSQNISERTASKFTGWLLITLAGYIATQALYALVAAKSKPEPSYLGIGLLIAAAVLMPWLSKRKRELAANANSAALRADAAQSSLCGYLSWIALGGLLLNAIWRLTWADALAALLLSPIIVKDAKEALEGKSCGCR